MLQVEEKEKRSADSADVAKLEEITGAVSNGWVASTATDGAVDGKTEERWIKKSGQRAWIKEGGRTWAGSGRKVRASQKLKKLQESWQEVDSEREKKTFVEKSGSLRLG